MIELTGIELAIPAIVSAVVVLIRNVSVKLDGSRAYWWALVLNVVGQVLAELVVGDGGATAATIGTAAVVGIGTGATVSVGMATAGKRVGLGKIIKPKR